MEIDKQQVIDLIREQGDQQKVQQAEQELPDKVDPEEHSDVLNRLGVDPQDLLKKMF